MDQEIINCHNKYNNQKLNFSGLCEPVWDGVYCWAHTAANSTSQVRCSDIFAVALGHSESSAASGEYFAYRRCNELSQWDWNNWTNYTECLTLLALQENIRQSLKPNINVILSYIVLLCSGISLICLITALIIFISFKKLHCTRITVHKNLCFALLLHSALLIIMSSPVLVTSSSFSQIDWLCKSLKSLNIYSSMATIYWMFIEGLLLHNRLYVSPFQSDLKSCFSFYYIIGWIFPAVCVLFWSLVLEFGGSFQNKECWQGYGQSKTIFIVTAPMILALVINTGFLFNIIRILFVKLKQDQSSTGGIKSNRIKINKATYKAIKATAFLIPLLGLEHLLFFINPSTLSAELESVYIIFNGLIQSLQGITVSILYCFANNEVKEALCKCWYDFVLRRNSCPQVSKRKRPSCDSYISRSCSNGKIVSLVTEQQLTTLLK